MYRLSVASGWITSQCKRGTNPTEFVIKPLADYIDINKTELRMVLKITKKDETPTGDGKKYTLINNAPHSIVKQFTIKINETLVTKQSDTQAYNQNHTKFYRAGQNVLLNKSSVLQRNSWTYG